MIVTTFYNKHSLVTYQHHSIYCPSKEYAEWLTLKMRRMLGVNISCNSIDATNKMSHEFRSLCDELGCLSIKRMLESNLDNIALLLDDCHHIITKHENGLNNIICRHDESSIGECTISLRHNRDREGDTHDANRDINEMFYENLTDSMHCFLFHMKHYGFRGEIEMNNNDSIKLERLDTGKYNIQMKHSGATFRDALFEYMLSMNMNEMKPKLVEEGYDTDAIEMDMNMDGDDYNHILTSNICKFCEGENKYNLLCKYLNHYKIEASSFSIGYTFFYWDYYKDKQDRKDQHYANQNNYSAYTPRELYIEQKIFIIKRGDHNK